MICNNTKKCLIKNCNDKPTRCNNYKYYYRIHFIRYRIACSILYKKNFIIENDLNKFATLANKIINSKNPKIHYKVGKFIQKFSIVLKNILPDRLYEKILLNYSKN